MTPRGFALGVMAVSALAGPPFVRADTWVWYELESGDGTLISQGVGEPLVLEIPPESGEYDVVVRMWADTEELEGYSYDLYEFGGEASVTWWEPLVPWPIVDDPYLGDHPIILYGAGQSCCPGGGAYQYGVLPLNEFSLRIDHTMSDKPGVIEIFSGIGWNGWPPMQQIFYADSTPLAANDYGVMTDTPSIIVLYVPEPASIAFCALGLLAALRRHCSVSNRAGVGQQHQRRRGVKERSNAR